MTDLEKIGAQVRSLYEVGNAPYAYEVNQRLDVILKAIISLKAEKPHGSECSCENCLGIPAQPDEGKMAWGVLKELADWRKIVSLEGGVATTQRYEWAEAIKKEINQVQAKYKEELTNKEK
jgi:hypothetical protein